MCILVAEDGDEVVGYVYAALEPHSWKELRDAAGFIHDVAVAEGHRGRGIGSLLVTGASEWLRAHGAPRVLLWTAERNTRSTAVVHSSGLSNNYGRDDTRIVIAFVSTTSAICTSSSAVAATRSRALPARSAAYKNVLVPRRLDTRPSVRVASHIARTNCDRHPREHCRFRVLGPARGVLRCCPRVPSRALRDRRSRRSAPSRAPPLSHFGSRRASSGTCARSGANSSIDRLR